MLQADHTMMGTEPSGLRAEAHPNTQIGVTAEPGSIRVSHPREFPGRTDSVDIFH